MDGAAVTERLNAWVAVSAVAVPESVTLKVTFAVPAPAANGVPASTPAEERVSPAGNEPLLTLHVYGEMPPLAASVTEYAAPTAPALNELVVIEGAAGTVSAADLLFVLSVLDVAVTVTESAALVAAGAVYVAALVVVLLSVPPPLTLHVTPAALTSFCTLAESETESVPSTVVTGALIDTLTGCCCVVVLLEPPQLERTKAVIEAASRQANLFPDKRVSFKWKPPSYTSG